MNRLFFWNEWKSNYKYFYLILLSIFSFCALLYLFFWITDFKFLFDWDIITQFDTVKVPIDHFSKGLLHYSIDADNFLVKERFFGTSIIVKPWMTYCYFSLTLLCILLCLTIITKTDLIWFAVGAGIFIFFIFNIPTVLLEVFGWQNRKFSLLVVFAFIGVAFYFQAYDKKFSFTQRFFIFILLAVLTDITLTIGTETPNPLLYIANYTIIVPVVLTVIFIFSVSYDIINGFLYITGSTKVQGKNSIFHFILISLLYLTNLFLIFLKKKGSLSDDFIHVDLFVIFLASAILGIWEHRKRKFIYENTLSPSLASFLYLTVALISLVTITYCFASGNDAMILAFEYAILYSHLGVGLLFFLYVIYNFGELFGRKVSAYKHVYAPRRFPFFMVRPLGFIIILALFLQSGRYPLKLAQAGYYNFVGDIYYVERNYEEAKKAYTEGTIYARLNKRSNFSLASTLSKLGEKKAAEEYYKNTLVSYPTEYAYLNLSNSYIQSDNFFYALFNLREGLDKFPKSGMLHNNMGMLYGSKGIWDSSFYHLNAAKKYLKEDDATSASNLMWFFSRKNFLAEADSLLDPELYKNYMSFLTNELVKQNLGNEKTDRKLNESFIQDSILNGMNYSYFFNYAINNLRSSDTTVLNHINRFITYQGNDNYYHELLYLKALKLYYLERRGEAIIALKNLSMISSPSSSLYHNRILGFWAMQHDAPTQAAEFFHNSIDFMNPESQFNKAIALLEAGATREAIEILTPLSKNPETKLDQISSDILKLYEIKNTGELLLENEETRVQYLHFRKQTLSEKGIKEIYSSLTESKYIYLAIAEIMEYYISRNMLTEAESIYSSFFNTGSGKDIKNAKSEMYYQYLLLLEAQGRWDELLKSVETISLPEEKTFFQSYFKGVAYWKKNNKAKAESELRQATEKSPYKEQAYIYLAELYNESLNFQKAYNVLLKGINFNSYSPELKKAYALQTLKLNLTNYGDLAMEELKEILSPSEYSEFAQIYNKEKALVEKQFEQF